MSDEQQLNEWVVDLEIARKEGTPLTPEDLAPKDRPDLLAALKKRWAEFAQLQGLLPTNLEPPRADETATLIGSGTRYGRFVVRKFHRQGGMGEVLLATDEELHREVALKRIRPKYRDDARAKLRFIREAEITSKLDHPGIVPVHGLVYDEDGQPCYAMRFVEGDTLEDAIAAFHKADVPGRDPGERSLAFRQLLQHFVALCKTIAYAHSRGVIHRDIKPGNVKLGKYGETLVVDWGLAKPIGEVGTDEDTAAKPVDGSLTDTPMTEYPLGTLPEEPSEDGGLTRANIGIGTPGYVSPEQAAGDWPRVGPASDIYSLGATLYHLLTNRPSVGGSHWESVNERIQRGEFPEPRQVKKNVPAPLEAICLKAMTLVPEQRYHSAITTVADIENWLADEPVSAFAEPISVRARRWARKHRTFVGSGVVALLFAVVALIGIILLVQRHAGVLEEQRTKLARRNELAVHAIETVASDSAIEQLSRAKALSSDQKDLLDKMIRYYDELTLDEAANEGERSRQAMLYFKTGQMNKILGRNQGSETAYLRAIAVQKQLAADFPQRPDHRQKLGWSYNNVGILHNDMGNFALAESDYTDALVTFKQLALDFPSRTEFRLDAAKSHNNLGRLFSTTGRLQAAESSHSESLDILKQLATENPDSLAVAQELARAHRNVASLLRKRGRLEAAESAYANALAIQKKLATAFPNQTDFQLELATMHIDMGWLLSKTGRHQAAESANVESLAILKQLAADFPRRPEFRRSVAISHNNIGGLFHETNRLTEAESAYKEALAIQVQLAAEFPSQVEFRQDVTSSMLSLGAVRSDMGRLTEAESAYKDALAFQRQLAADFPSRPEFRQALARIHHNLGLVFRKTGRLQEAELAYTDSLNIKKQMAVDFPNRPEFREDLAMSYNNLGVLRINIGRLKAAESDFVEALAIRKSLAAEFPNQPAFRQELGRSQNNLGSLLFMTGQMQAAEMAHNESLATKKQLATDFPKQPEFRQDLAMSYSNLGDVFDATGRGAAAESAYSHALDIFKELSVEFPNALETRNYVAQSFGHLAILHRKQRNFGVASKLLAEAIPYHETALRESPRHSDYRKSYGENLTTLTECCAGDGRRSAALAAASKRRDVGWSPSADTYDAACALARCVPIVEKDDKLDNGKRQAEVQFYSDEAMKMLRDAVGRGYRDVAHMKKDPDLDPLRLRDDFKQLIAELEIPIELIPVPPQLRP